MPTPTGPGAAHADRSRSRDRRGTPNTGSWPTAGPHPAAISSRMPPTVPLAQDVGDAAGLRPGSRVSRRPPEDRSCHRSNLTGLRGSAGEQGDAPTWCVSGNASNTRPLHRVAPARGRARCPARRTLPHNRCGSPAARRPPPPARQPRGRRPRRGGSSTATSAAAPVSAQRLADQVGDETAPAADRPVPPGPPWRRTVSVHADYPARRVRRAPARAAAKQPAPP